MKRYYRLTIERVLLLLLFVGTMLFVGCSRKPGFSGPDESLSPPRGRPSCYATRTIGTKFADPDNLGTHCYKSGKNEKSGILYACNAGHIDLAHLRKGADWTYFFARRTLEQLQNNSTSFSFKFYEPSRYFVKVEYPENWKTIPDEQKNRIARDISIRLGQYFAFVGCTWHEIITWFGYRCFELYPEFPSSFSWEDTYSNLLGTQLAAQAMRRTDYTFDEAMTVLIERELDRLGIQSKETAITASEKMRGKWFSGRIFYFIKVKGRNFDIGLDDGSVTPWLVPALEQCPVAQPQDCPAPNLDFLAQYGFSVKLEIEPRIAESKKILTIACPGNKKRAKRIEPAVHFRPIMACIESQAQEKCNLDAGPGN